MKLIKTKLQNGLDFWYRSDDKFIGQRIALRKYEEYESELIVKTLRLAQGTSTAVDVGANIGYYTLLLAKICKKVYAIEPDKTCFEILQKNVKENNLKNVVAINKAVGDKKEIRALIIDNSNFGNSHLTPQSCGQLPLTGEQNIISTDILDNILKNEKQIDLIKIDVQGWEGKVIDGSKKIIKKYSPVLFLEFNGDYKIIKFLKNYYKNIFTIDYWFYILKKGIKIDPKIGYADLLVTNKNIYFWERYNKLQWKKIVKYLFKI